MPMWSPYFRNPKDYVKQPLSGWLPAAYWFEQYGFRGGSCPRTRSGFRATACRRGRPTTGRGAEERRRVVGASRAEPVAHGARGAGGCVPYLPSITRAGDYVGVFVVRLPPGLWVMEPLWVYAAAATLFSGTDTRFERVTFRTGIDALPSAPIGRRRACTAGGRRRGTLVDHDAPEALAALQDMDGLVRLLDALQSVRDEVVDRQLARQMLVHEARNVVPVGVPSVDGPRDRYAIMRDSSEASSTERDFYCETSVGLVGRHVVSYLNLVASSFAIVDAGMYIEVRRQACSYEDRASYRRLGSAHTRLLV